MRKRGWLLAAAALPLAVLSAGASFEPKLAKACGGVFSARLRKDERKPALAYEQALVIHDAKSGREHLIREVVFKSAARSFGFVVPTPARPEVAKVAGNPFERLRAMYPFRPPIAAGLGSGQGFGAGPGAKGRAVRVLEAKKVGSFTAFVLAADDDKALAAWLAKHGLESSPEAEPWLAHYVRAKYFFVAMRYDPEPEDRGVGSTRSEVVRFSFDTPLPYYPYFEPDVPRDRDDLRMLEVWLVASRATVPVALQATGGTLRWVRPFAEGFRYEAPRREDLELALGADKQLLFADKPMIQRFLDQKRSRSGFGDVIFVPTSPEALDAAKLAPLSRALDPSLAGAP